MSSPLPDPAVLEDRKTHTRTWFESLRDEICATFETLERNAPTSLYDQAPGSFVRSPWSRTDHTGAPGGGGVMAMMRGRRIPFEGLEGAADLVTQALEPGARACLAVFEDGRIGQGG